MQECVRMNACRDMHVLFLCLAPACLREEPIHHFGMQPVWRPETSPRRLPIRVPELQNGSRRLKIGPGSSKMGPGGSKIGPGSSKIDSRRACGAPKLTSETPASHLKIPECSRRAPRWLKNDFFLFFEQFLVDLGVHFGSIF